MMNHGILTIEKENKWSTHSSTPIFNLESNIENVVEQPIESPFSKTIRIEQEKNYIDIFIRDLEKC